jgi:hypothetical protein
LCIFGANPALDILVIPAADELFALYNIPQYGFQFISNGNLKKGAK